MKFHMQRRNISISPVKNGRKGEFGTRRTKEGEIVSVQEHLKIRFTTIAM